MSKHITGKTVKAQKAQAEGNRSFISNVVLSIKVALIVAVVFTSLVGVYVIGHATLRNQTIDFAQNQNHNTVQAESSPKGLK